MRFAIGDFVIVSRNGVLCQPVENPSVLDSQLTIPLADRLAYFPTAA